MGLTLSHLSFILALSGMVIASIALIIGCLAYIKSQAIEASTHRIEYMPVDPAVDQYNESLLSRENTEKDNSWATSEDTLRKQREMYSEDLEDSMPDFALSKEDKEIISF